jgi:dephospho-CoA kinase
MRILITGMSGTGKSTVIVALAARGYAAVDFDSPQWSEIRPMPDGQGGTLDEWVWREDRVGRLLSEDRPDVLFVSGASNQVRFYPRFDQIVLLSAPSEVLTRRLAERTTNSYGKTPEQLAEVLENQRTVEPLLRRRATLELDASQPVIEILERLIALGRA